MRTCTKCFRVKDLSKFDPHRYQCRQCRTDWRKGDKQRCKALKYFYNLTMQQYNQMLEDQGGLGQFNDDPELIKSAAEYLI